MQADEPTRRSSLGVILGIAALATVGIGIGLASSSDDDDKAMQDVAKTSIEMQKAYGWAFGAAGEPLVFDGVTEKPFSAIRWPSCGATSPSREDLAPYSVRTRCCRPPASAPTLKTAGDPAPFVRLEQVLEPMHNTATDAAFSVGQSLASLLKDVRDVAVVVDRGPSSVALAAGMADDFDVVFLLDNWPHPRGVVTSHEALAVAAYYQPLFDVARKSRVGRKPPPSPVFVLDSRRLADYVDATDRFDNRWVARLPSATALKKLGLKHVLYVTDLTREVDDLNDDFVAYENESIDVRYVRPDAFGKRPLSSKAEGVDVIMCYGGDAGSHEYFFVHYPSRDSTRHPVRAHEGQAGGRAVQLPREPAGEQFQLQFEEPAGQQASARRVRGQQGRVRQVQRHAARLDQEPHGHLEPRWRIVGWMMARASREMNSARGSTRSCAPTCTASCATSPSAWAQAKFEAYRALAWAWRNNLHLVERGCSGFLRRPRSGHQGLHHVVAGHDHRGGRAHEPLGSARIRIAPSHVT